LKAKILGHFKSRMLSGLKLLLPFVIIYWILKLVIGAVDDTFTPIISMLPFVDRAPFKTPGIGIVLVLIVLYILGAINTYTHGERLVKHLQKLFEKVPLYRTLKETVEQLLGHKDAKAVRPVLLLDYPNAGYVQYGLVTSEQIINGALYFTVFIPTPPMINSGNVVTVASHKVVDILISNTGEEDSFTPMKIEDCLIKFYLTNGVKAPKHVRTKICS